MKTEYEQVFVAHVATAVEKAQALGSKATWTTAKHLDALAEACTKFPDRVRDVLQECYNVSAYQQVLAKKFAALGHFQREKDKPVGAQLDDMLSKLVAETAAKRG